jgi:hypothetical protein
VAKVEEEVQLILKCTAKLDHTETGLVYHDIWVQRKKKALATEYFS